LRLCFPFSLRQIVTAAAHLEIYIPICEIKAQQEANEFE
jgi:hypothetical protein